MTKSELRQYAKLNNMSINEARKQVIEDLEQMVKATAEEDLKFFSIDELQQGRLFLFPQPVKTTEYGVVNYQIYGEYGEMPVYTNNTSFASAYISTVVMNGRRGEEHMVVVGNTDGAHLVISYVGTFKQSPYFITQVLKSLPDEHRAYIDRFIANNGELPMAAVYDATTPLGLLPKV